MTSFNDGIEAAEKWHAERADSYFRRMDKTPPGSKRSFLAGRHSFHSWASEEIRALKRPEPSEDEKVERMAAAIKKRAIETAQADESEDWFAEQFARAALKAMEGE